MFDLTGRKALVTGASGGIGEAIARVLHAQGAIVGLHGTRVEKLEALAADSATGSSCSRPTCRTATRSRRLARRPKPSSKASTSSSTMPASPRTACSCACRDADWDSVIEVNLTAVFRLTRELTHPMMRRRYGRIINITSVVGVTGNPGQTNYCASKAGMIGFSKSLAQEIATRNITVNCVAPGLHRIGDDRQAQRQAEGSDHGARSRRRRMGTGAEVASAVAYLASNEAAYVTGQTIHVNGGMAMI